MQENNPAYLRELARQQAKIVELENTIKYLTAQLSKQQSVKQQAKSLYHGIDDAVMSRIDAKGYARKTHTNLVPFPAVDLAAMSRQELLNSARLYDAQAYFSYRNLSETMKPQYKLASKLYRTARNVTKSGLKQSYKLVRRGKN